MEHQLTQPVQTRPRAAIRSQRPAIEDDDLHGVYLCK